MACEQEQIDRDQALLIWYVDLAMASLSEAIYLAADGALIACLEQQNRAAVPDLIDETMSIMNGFLCDQNVTITNADIICLELRLAIGEATAPAKSRAWRNQVELRLAKRLDARKAELTQ